MIVCIDVDPSSNKIIGSDIHGNIIESNKPVLIESPRFEADGVIGVVVEEKRRLRGLKNVVRNDDGEFMNFSGDVWLLNAAYSHVNPNGEISYTNAR